MSGTNLNEKPSAPNLTDAAHTPVVSVKAGGPLKAGDNVSITNGIAFFRSKEFQSRAEGVVNPFLGEDVKYGELVWILVNPQNITNVRHSWDFKGASSEGEEASCGEEEAAEKPRTSLADALRKVRAYEEECKEEDLREEWNVEGGGGLARREVSCKSCGTASEYAKCEECGCCQKCGVCECTCRICGKKSPDCICDAWCAESDC